MARPNVTVVIDDQSYVVPFSESASSVRGGMPSKYGLILALGYTAERKEGMMTVESPGQWIERLGSTEPTASSAWTDNNHHISGSGTGTTGARWPTGPTGAWKNEFWAAHNYLQYGGVLVVGATGTESNTAVGSEFTGLKDKQVPIDVVFAATGGYAASVGAIASYRRDCVAVTNTNQSGIASPVPGSATFQATNDEYNICVYGAKKHLDITRGVDDVSADASYITTNCAADVAGCIARNDKLADPWISPAGFRRGQILDVVSLIDNPTDAEMDDLYDTKINPIVTFPGEGTVLFGDKTGAANTSTLSRINVSRLFIYLKKVIGAAARGKLFEINDATTRASFVNAVNPVLSNIRSRRGLYDYRVICDESNNPDSLIDANHFAADIFVKPSKSINFIRITFTNKNTADALE